ncbi:septum formation initiator family protein [Ruminococcaceae bacterium OttesenSCG-928-I18]|nr:septum formation initiator family protein [Ruminococcaceae bacterium OttesenSCG-928-I18]
MRKLVKDKKEKGVLSSLLFKLALAAGVVYLLVSIIGGQLQVAEKQRELDAVTARVEQQTVKNAELQQLMDSGDEDAYVERIAREKMGYARPDERVFVDISGQ